MSRAGTAQVNPAGHVPTTFFELAKNTASGRLGPSDCATVHLAQQASLREECEVTSHGFS